MYISIDTGCPVAENSSASPAVTSMYLTLFLNLQMETSPVLETEHLHYYFFFYSVLFAILENDLKGKANEVEDFKENSLLCITSRITAYRKNTATYNYQRTLHLPEVKHFVKFQV